MAEELYKQPAESRLYHFVFTNLLASGETISTVTSVTQVNLGKVAGSSDVTIGPPTKTTNIAQVRISGGTNYESYKLSALVTTSDSNILELDGILHVRDL
jgi:hypothetical protein